MKRVGKNGFTIVELLIVVVVIAILAAITIVSYQGISAQANDSRRLQDIATIRKALELHKTKNGTYPTPQPNPGIASWEVSVDQNFLVSLKETASTIPLDPINDTSHYYAYYRYSAGTNGCPASIGNYYVLRITSLVSKKGQDVSDIGVCPGITGASRTPTNTQAIFVGAES